MPVQNEIFLPPWGHLDYKTGCLCVWNKREMFCFVFSDRKMNEAAEELQGLCVCSSMRDPGGYWSQLGTATVLPPEA